MFDKTRKRIKDIVLKIRATGLIFNIIGQLFPMGYLIFLIHSNIGSQTANKIFLAISIAYFCLFLFMELRDFNKSANKSAKRWIRIIYRWGKKIITLLLIIIPSYGVAVTVQDFSPLALIMLLITILGIIWEIVSNIFIGIMKKIFRKKKQTIVDDFKLDWMNFRNHENEYEDDPNDFSNYGDIHEEN